MDWIVEHRGHEYITSGWALYLLVGCVVLTLPAGAWLLVTTRRWGWRWTLGRGALAGLAALTPFLVGASVLVAIFLGWSATLSDDLGCPRGDIISASDVFNGLLWAETLGAALASLLVVVPLALWLGRRPPSPEEGRRAAPPLIALGLMLILSFVGAGHAAWLCTAGGLPQIHREGPTYAHLDREAWLRTTLTSCMVPPGWSAPRPLAVDTSTPGRQEGSVEASSRWFTVRRTFTTRVGREVGSATFPLRVGNRWSYAIHRTGRDRALFGMIALDDQPRDSVTHMEITGVELRDGLRLFQLEISDGQNRREVPLFAFEGRVIGLSGDRAFHVMQTRPENEADHPRSITSIRYAQPYTFLLIPSTCTGFTSRNDGPLGPAECRRGSLERNVELGIMTTLFSGGLVSITGGGRMDARLIRSSWGPDDAPEAPNR